MLTARTSRGSISFPSCRESCSTCSVERFDERVTILCNSQVPGSVDTSIASRTASTIVSRERLGTSGFLSIA